MKKRTNKTIKEPWKIQSYFQMETWTLVIITITGILYNIGMIAGPWFEGQLAQKLFDIMEGKQTFRNMVQLSLTYVAVIFCVQFFRFFKRLYVRKFANHINRSMKQTIYQNLISQNKKQFETEGIGNLMTKAIPDVDTCVEGMRKFTTEVFDTGVVMLAYMTMLLSYDWRLALLSFLFPPIAYVIAEKLKRVVSQTASAYKESAGKLNSATLDRISNAITYRVYGQEENQNFLYEERLKDYETKAIYANLWETSMQPIYQIIVMAGIFFILWLGAKNVMQIGWTNWNIAAFTTFISCYTKLAAKSSKAAKLFNAVQKARVSWKRIYPFMKVPKESGLTSHEKLKDLKIKNLGVKYDSYLFQDLSLEAKPGQIIGVTGPVACGKTAFGKALLGEINYEGQILMNQKPLSDISYMGHDPELLSDTIEQNILLGSTGDVWPYLKIVCMDKEVKQMEDGIHTMIGNSGTRLSGGQQARIALARTLFHKRAVLVLDDPFSAVDKVTENLIFCGLQEQNQDSVIFLISHRLDIFPKFDQIIWMEHGETIIGDHKTLMHKVPSYSALYQLQNGGSDHEK